MGERDILNKTLTKWKEYTQRKHHIRTQAAIENIEETYRGEIWRGNNYQDWGGSPIQKIQIKATSNNKYMEIVAENANTR